MQDSQPSIPCTPSNPMLDFDRFVPKSWRVHARVE
jgi:hypothetical protein